VCIFSRSTSLCYISHTYICPHLCNMGPIFMPRREAGRIDRWSSLLNSVLTDPPGFALLSPSCTLVEMGMSKDWDGVWASTEQSRFFLPLARQMYKESLRPFHQFFTYLPQIIGSNRQNLKDGGCLLWLFCTLYSSIGMGVHIHLLGSHTHVPYQLLTD
jgi:hypothetical protein